MITEAVENAKDIRLNGNEITNLRYADDAVFVAVRAEFTGYDG